MYYSSGNYEAFARPRKPKGVDEKSAYIVGAGLAGLAAAAFLVRDGQMDGRRITIFDAAKLAGGAMDGIKHSETGYRIRGDREQEDHMECLWDLMRSIPSIEVEGASVLDEFYWLNKEGPTYSLRRATRNRGEPIPMADKMTLSPQALRELATLAITRDEDLYDKRVSDVVGQEFLDSNFWLFFKTMFAMIPCHSALELKLYLNRFVHVISGMHDLSGITFTRYNQYESFIVPWVKWLEGHGVTFVYDTRVTNVLFDITASRKVARRIEWLTAGKRGARDLTENDLVFMTIGSPVENSSWGDQHTPAKFDTEIREGSIWALWRNIAKQHPSFGRPDKFCTNIHELDPDDGDRDLRSGQGGRLHPEDQPAQPVRARRPFLHRRKPDLPQTPPGRSRGTANGSPTSRRSGPMRSSAGSSVSSPTSPATSCRSRCWSAPARRSPRSGSTTWGRRSRRLATWRAL